MNNRRCIIGQSGGPTVAINATLAGIIERANQCHFDKIYGMINGIEGLLNENIIELSRFEQPYELYKLIHTPAMYLGSCRFKLKNDGQQYIQKIFDILQAKEITDFFYIGGNDSMDTIKQLSTYAKEINSPIHFIGLPKTIDNDLVNTMYTPGYPSACHYVATTLSQIALDNQIYPMKSITIVEIMGRDAGWLTASAQIVNEVYSGMIDFIYMPEVPFHTDDCVKAIQERLKIKNHLIIAISEGVRDEFGECIETDKSIQVDAFGHRINAGSASYLKRQIDSKVECKVRAIQLSTLQRCSASLASELDLDNAVALGYHGVNIALENKTGVMVNINYQDKKFITGDVDIHLVANLVKPFPQEWIDKENALIKKEFIDYVAPLIYKSGNIELMQYSLLHAIR